MKIATKKILKLTQILMLIVVSSCVGTIEDNNKVDESKLAKSFLANFAGVENAFPISHDKIQLQFRPAVGGSGLFSYVAYRDGNFSQAAASLSGKNTVVDHNGFVNMVVKNLPTPGETYDFIVRVIDQESGEDDGNSVTLSVATYGDIMPDFNGILSLENLAGLDGQSKIKVNWTQAQAGSEGSGGFGANPYAISGYMIYVSETAEGIEDTSPYVTLDDQPNTTSHIVTGLDKNKKYFFLVRAVDSNTPKRQERNLKITSLSTMGDTPIEFAGLKTATIPTSADGYFQINLSWDGGSGPFDRFRIFYTDNMSVATINPTNHSVVGNADGVSFQDVLDLSQKTYTLFVPNPNTAYKIAVVACNGASCSNFKGQEAIKIATTSPPVSPFNGIKTITTGEGLESVSAIILGWDLPNADYGTYDDIRIYQEDASGNRTEITASSVGAQLANKTSTSVKVVNLSEGAEYCFVAKAYIDDPNFPPYGREDTNEKKMCMILQYTIPSFSGVIDDCVDLNTSSFSVNWNDATGVFSNYELFIFQGKQVDFSYTDAFAGDPNYTRILLPTNETTYFIDSLLPNRSYTVGVKTYFQHPGTSDEYRSIANLTVQCDTPAQKLVPQGWTDVMALGPKVDGLNLQPVMEAMLELGDKTVDGDTAPFPIPVDFNQIENLDALPPVNGVNASNTGMVRLSWQDFQYDSGIGRFCGTICDSLGVNDGYWVYRMDYDPVAHAGAAPSVSDAGWTLLNESSPAKTKLYLAGDFKYWASFTDYSVDVTNANGNEEGKVYWYKVEPVINGQLAPIAGAAPKDYVIKVIVPPNNMALVHRWIGNKMMCERMGKVPDRDNQYRCDYNGLGKQTWNIGGTNQYFYDMAGHLLVDRFELGCNFTRGSSPNACSGGNFPTTDDPVKGLLAGDCIESGHWTKSHDLPGSAPDGAVAYNPGHAIYRNLDNNAEYQGYSCFLRTGGVWKSVNALEGALNSNFTSSMGDYAYEVAHNNSHLPALGGITQTQMNNLCEGFNVSLNGNTYKKRIPRRKEQQLFVAWNPLGGASNAYVEAGTTVEKGCASTASGTNRRLDGVGDPLAPEDYNKGPSLDANNDPLVWDLTGYKYTNAGPRAGSNVLAPMIMATGSQGVGSTSFCQSRFGVQDAVGNRAEWLSDQFNCDALGCHAGNFSPYLDFFNQDNYLNVDGDYLSFLHDASGANFGLSISYFRVNSGVPGKAFTHSESRYFSVPFALPLTCSGGTCSGESDDNVLVSLKDSGNVPLASVNSYDIGTTSGRNIIATSYVGLAGLVGGASRNEGNYDNMRLYGRGANGANYFEIIDSTDDNFNLGGRCSALVGEDRNGRFN